MIKRNEAGILLSMVAAVLLSGCGVRDVDGVGSDGGLEDVATGSDTSEIEGLWMTNSGSFALISAEGEWTHIRLDVISNCYNSTALPLQFLGVNPASTNDQYVLGVSASGLPAALNPFDAFVGDDGRMTILEEGAGTTVFYLPNTEFVPEDVQYCTSDVA